MSKPVVKTSCSFREMIEGKDTDTTVSPEYQLEPVEVLMLEMEDVLFHLDSAVMMPERPKGKSSSDGDEDDATDPDDAKLKKDQDKVSGLRALALSLKQFEFDPDKRLLIAGHADTSGPTKMNFELSDLRSQNVLSLLEGNSYAFAGVSEKRHRIEDYQQILMYVKDHRSWSDCDPVKIDDKWSTDVDKAIRAFIKRYNDWQVSPDGPGVDLDHPLSESTADKIKQDSPKHKWPIEMWFAVYHIFDDDIAAALQVDRWHLNHDYRSGLSFCDADKKYIACGESYPIDDAEKDNYRSQVNRRVELLFFDKESVPTIDCPARVDTVHKAPECPMWHKYHFKRVYADGDDLTSVAYHLKFVFFDRVSKKWRDVPDGLTIKAYENDTVEIKGTRLKYSRGVYILKVPDKPSPERKDIHFTFETKDAWIYSADGADPVIETRAVSEAREGGKTLRLTKEGGVEKWDKLMPLDRRIYYYDLPEGWSSQNYWTRYDGDMTKGDRFKKVFQLKKFKPYGGEVTSKGQPLVFSLDDIVLADKDGKQDILDKDETDAKKPLSDDSRFSLFYVKDDKLLLYTPEDQATQPYFTKASFKSNLITDTPADGQARLIAFANDFYHCYDRRAAQGVEPFNPLLHVKGCRVARLEDKKWHVGARFSDKNNTWGHRLYFTPGTGEFELHYVHDACMISGPNGLKRRSFLLIYWNGFFMSHPTNTVTTGIDPTDPHYDPVLGFATKGLMNAFKRWEDKGYTIEPAKIEPGYEIQIKPVFFFEAKQKFLSGNRRGGKPKCTVTVSSAETGWMNVGTETSDMYWEDYKERNYLKLKPAEFTDKDGKKYGTLVVAHELDHALGKDDEYAYDRDNLSDPANPTYAFKQYYLGMPYRKDDGSMMIDNRAPRLKHFWFYVNWINDASTDANQLQPFLKGTQFKVVHRYGTSQLNYHLAGKPNDYRDIYKPFKEKKGIETGTGKVDLALYKLGEDEAAWLIMIGGMETTFVFDGVLVVFIKLSVNFDGGTNQMAEDWIEGMLRQINGLNNRFFLQKATEKHDFKNTYVMFFPVVGQTTAGEPSHYDITVKFDNSTKIMTKSGKTLKIGNNLSKLWIIKYILGEDPWAIWSALDWLLGEKKPGKSNLKFVEKWFKIAMKEKGMDDSFELKGE